MELLQVEPVTQRSLRLHPSPRPRHVPDLVAARLTRLRAVPLNLALRPRPREPGGRDHIVGRLLAAPLFRMDTRIDHQPRRAEQKRLKISRPLQRRRIRTKFVGKLLRIQRPAFRIGREEADLAQRRDILRFLREADLEVMPRHALVIGQRRQRVFRPVADVLQIDEVDRRTAAIERGAVVIAVRRAILDLDRHRADFERLRRHIGKRLGQFRVHCLDAVVQPGDQLGPAFRGVRVKLVRRHVQLRQPLADGPGREALRLEDRIELRGDLRDLRQADAVDLVGAHRRRGRLVERHRVDRVAVRYAPDAVAGFGGRFQPLDQGDLAVERRIDLRVDDLRSARLPVAGEALGGGTLHQRLDDARRRGRLAPQLPHLAERQVERPAGREQAARRLGLLHRAFLIQDGAELIEPRQISLCVRRRRDRVCGVEEVGHLEIGAALLEDPIRADRTVHAERLGRGDLRAQRIAHHFEVQLGRRRQACAVVARETGERRLGLGDITRALVGRTRRELALQACERSLVETQRCRELGRPRHAALEDALEVRVERGIAARLRECRGREQRGGKRGDTARCEELATIHDELSRKCPDCLRRLRSRPPGAHDRSFLDAVAGNLSGYRLFD